MIEQMRRQLHRDEGAVIVNGRHVVYDDHLGFATIGYGRLVDQRRGGGLSDAEAEFLLSNDIERVARDLTIRLPWFSDLDEPRQGALINMAFQLGVNGLLAFRKTLPLIEAGKWDDAAAEALRSAWARQTPNRAKRIAQQIRTGEWQ